MTIKNGCSEPQFRDNLTVCQNVRFCWITFNLRFNYRSVQVWQAHWFFFRMMMTRRSRLWWSSESVLPFSWSSSSLSPSWFGGWRSTPRQRPTVSCHCHCLYVDVVVVDLRRLTYHKLASLLKSQWSMWFYHCLYNLVIFTVIMTMSIW